MNNRKNTVVGILLLTLVISTTACSKQEDEKVEAKVLKQVKTFVINKNAEDTGFIETTGTIKAEAQIEVTATTKGTVRAIHFKIGDKVKLNKILASLYDNSTLASLNNAQTNQSNMKSNLDAIERITNESIRQAEIGVQAALEQIESAKISLSSAKTNLDNAKTLRQKGNLDSKNQAIISYNNYLSIISDIMDDVNYIIQADDSKDQIPGIKNVISVKDKTALLTAKSQYQLSNRNLQALKTKIANSDNISSLTAEINSLFSETKALVDSTLTVLSNTVSSNSFSSATLSSQETSLTATRNAIANYQVTSKATLHNLQNQTPVYNQEIDALENAVTAAANRLDSANTGYENSLIVLENAKQSKKQQLLASKSSLDSAQGQLNLALIQTSDLSIKAPINGEITQKYIELGADINPGQKIAQISQTDSVKIEVDIPANDIYRIDKDAMVKIGETMEGEISYINSVANPISKKIKIEILYDNKDKNLIPGTFVTISLATKKQTKSTANSVYVPIKAVNITQNEKIVYILEDGKAKKVLVETATTDGKTIEITKGLEQDDQLIIDGNKSITDGEEVELFAPQTLQ